jgi:hypothetical protein
MKIFKYLLIVLIIIFVAAFIYSKRLDICVELGGKGNAELSEGGKYILLGRNCEIFGLHFESGPY